MTSRGGACERPTHQNPTGRTGTMAGFVAHREANEQACDACLDARRQRDRDKYAEDPEPKKKAAAAWRAANPQKAKEVAAEYRKKPENREAARMTSLRWREAHPERFRASIKAWRERNREKIRAYGARRRERSAAAATDEQPVTLDDLIAFWGAECVWCGVSDATGVDHVVTVSRGGKTAAENLVPSCLSCNSSKKEYTATEWLIRRVELGRPVGPWAWGVATGILRTPTPAP